jgi:hypothetical protein
MSSYPGGWPVYPPVVGLGPSSRYLISRTVTPASSLALVTLDEAKTELGIDLADTTQDAAVQQVIDRVSQGISNYCDRVFPRQSYTDQYRAVCSWLAPGQPLRTRQAPIGLGTGGLPVLTVAEDGATIDPAFWEVDIDTGELYRLDDAGSNVPASWTGNLIVINYDGGFDTIPADVEGAALEWITGRWTAKGRDPTIRSETIPDVIARVYSDTSGTAYTAGASMPAVVRDWLASYIKYYT